MYNPQKELDQNIQIKMITLKQYRKRSKGIWIVSILSLIIWMLILGCNSNRPLLPGVEFVLYDCDGSYVEAYRYAHNHKLVYIPFKSEADTCSINPKHHE